MRCNAYARSTGAACKAKALANGRCKNHGGLSTGANTIEGKQRLAEALKTRMTNGQKEMAMSAYQDWFVSGGREMLRRKALRREYLKRLKRHFATSTRACASWASDVGVENYQA